VSAKLTTVYMTGAMERRLGYGRRGVELLAEHFGEAISQALDLWNEFRSRVVYGRAQSVITRESEPYSIDLDDDCLGCRAVFFLVPYYDVAGGLTVFELTEQLTITKLGIKDIALSRSAWENYRRVRGVEPSWHVDEESSPRKLVFYAPSGPYDAGYELLYPWTDPVQIKADRDALFLRAVEGFVRYVLAEIRGKFGGTVIAPGGGSFKLNSDMQYQRAEKILEEVRETLRASRPNMATPQWI